MTTEPPRRRLILPLVMLAAAGALTWQILAETEAASPTLGALRWVLVAALVLSAVVGLAGWGRRR